MSVLFNQKDAVAWLKKLENDSIDLVITDPPYESLEKHRKLGTKTRLKQSKGSSNDWFLIFSNRRFPSLFRQLWRVMKPGTHLYMFCDQETLFVLKPIAERYGFVFRKFLIWDKKAIGLGYSYRSQHELILFLEKPNKNGKRRKLNDLSVSDILSFKRLKGVQYYPAEKPVPLLEVLINQSSSLGDLVIDPFMGSGAVGVAAVRNQRRFQGADISAHSINTTKERLQNEI